MSPVIWFLFSLIVFIGFMLTLGFTRMARDVRRLERQLMTIKFNHSEVSAGKEVETNE